MAGKAWCEDFVYRTGQPLGNGYFESFNGKLRDELLNLEIFTTLEEAKVLIEQWRREYNQIRPHSAKNYQPPAPEAVLVGTTKKPLNKLSCQAGVGCQ